MGSCLRTIVSARAVMKYHSLDGVGESVIAVIALFKNARNTTPNCTRKLDPIGSCIKSEFVGHWDLIRRSMKGQKMAVRGNAQQITEKWKQRTSGATQQVIEGVQRVTEAPGQKAARQKAVWLANLQAKADKWERNVQRVSLSEWQAATVSGAQRIAAGVQAKAGKMEAFMTEFIPHIENVQRKVQAMPRGTLEQNLARMMENARGMASFKRGTTR